MSSEKPVSKTGLTYFWSKIVAYIENIFPMIGNTQMGTTAQTITGAIKEHNDKIGDTTMGTTATTLTGAIAEHTDQIGDTTMGTTAETLTGAIAEHEQDISDLNSKTNFRIVEVTGSEFTISANNTTAWVNVPFPSSGTPIAIVGYYILGDANVAHMYSIKLQSTFAEFALRRLSTGTAISGTITARYLVVD